jgi:hypothetical protein
MLFSTDGFILLDMWNCVVCRLNGYHQLVETLIHLTVRDTVPSWYIYNIVSTALLPHFLLKFSMELMGYIVALLSQQEMPVLFI